MLARATFFLRTAALLLLVLDASTGKQGLREDAAALNAEERFHLANQRQLAGVQMANAGNIAHAVHEFEDCVNLLEGLEDHKTLRAQVISMIGNAHTLMGNISKGLSFWLKAVKVDPRIIDARQNVIKSFTDQGRFADALKHARKALQLHPANVDFLVAMGDACKALRNFTCAKNSYHRVLSLDPQHFVATFSLAVAHRDLMELNMALPLFERAGELDRENTAVVNALAVVRGDTCLWGTPDFSDPAFTEAKGNRFITTAKSGPPQRQSPIHPLLLAYYIDDPVLLKLVTASQARLAEREAAVYIGMGLGFRVSGLGFLGRAGGRCLYRY
jgi:tetratricopeptide (TPR) repeat protein